jgi:hypothetical protein
MAISRESSAVEVDAYFVSRGLDAPDVDGGALLSFTKAELIAFGDDGHIYSIVEKIKKAESVDQIQKLEVDNNQLQGDNNRLKADNDRLRVEINDVINSCISF